MSDRLYELLPAYLRYRDWYEGEPLRALMAALEGQARQIEEHVDGLYDDWFIETCQERIAPLLGELLGVHGLDRPEAWVPSQRARVANTLALRRLKGAPAVLARAARDATGWPAVAVEFFERLSATQAVGHLRPGRGGTADLRDTAALDRLDGPFDRFAHTVQACGVDDLRPAPPRAGYNVPLLGLYLWRLRAYPVRERAARKLAPGRYTVHPLGVDQPLFGRGSTPEGLTTPYAEDGVPAPLRRAPLAAELERRRADRPAAAAAGEPPPFEIHDVGTGAPLPAERIAVADLADWSPPPAAAGRVAVDPERGRILFPEDRAPGGTVRVSYAYGLAGDLGGGPYERAFGDVADAAAGAAPGAEFPSVGAAVEAWRRRSPAPDEPEGASPEEPELSIIRIADSEIYGGWPSAGAEEGWGETEQVLDLPAGAWLVIEAEPGAVPCLTGDLVVRAAGGSRRPRLTLAGLTIGGSLELEGALDLDLRHCTLRSERPADACLVAAEASDVSVRVASSIVGPIRLGAGGAMLEIVDSVVDGGGSWAIAGDGDGRPGPRAVVARSTLFGPAALRRLERGEDALFCGPLGVEERHLGVVSHCWLPAGSATPRREFCQPDLALAGASSDAERDLLRARLRPAFTSTVFGQPGYAQLGERCPPEIAAGASNGAEMGVFQSLRNAHRRANLPGILDEYLPWGLQARIFYVT